jgi:hypothetical protein
MILLQSGQSGQSGAQRRTEGMGTDVMTEPLAVAIYCVPLLFSCCCGAPSAAHPQASVAVRDDAVASGLIEPRLHPVVNPSTCYGCGARVAACQNARPQGARPDRRKATLIG